MNSCIGGEYSHQRARNERHVVLCATELRMDVIIDFLNEFYAYPNLQDYFVVLLTPVELCGSLKRFLQIPVWMHRVVYLQGSALNDIDLMRAKVNDAEACFILTSRSEIDKRAADEKTVLRAMAIKDFAPYCPLYVQILTPDSKFHVKFADQVICDEEFKYALLALNCDLPGISTAIVLLSHTTQEMEEDDLDCEWKKHINQSINSEIYDVEASESKFFGESISQSFTTAAYTAYKKYGALLIGVNRNDKIMLNPGASFKIEQTDTLYYICSSSEDSAIIIHSNEKRVKGTEGFRAAFLAGIAPIDLDQHSGVGAGVEGKLRDAEEGTAGIGVDRVSAFESASDRRSAFKNKLGVEDAKIPGRANDEETYEWMTSCEGLKNGKTPKKQHLFFSRYLLENHQLQRSLIILLATGPISSISFTTWTRLAISASIICLKKPVWTIVTFTFTVSHLECSRRAFSARTGTSGRERTRLASLAIDSILL